MLTNEQTHAPTDRQTDRQTLLKIIHVAIRRW